MLGGPIVYSRPIFTTMLEHKGSIQLGLHEKVALVGALRVAKREAGAYLAV